MFRVDAGEQYKFGKIQVLINEKIPDSIQTLNITSIASLKSKINTPALASSVIEDEQTIRQWIELNKCFFEYNVRHSAVVNNLKKQVDITYYITVKSEATFGKISFVGNKTISALYLNRFISIQEGHCFKRSEINTAKSILKKSGLFAEVNVILPLTPLPGRKVPVIFNLKEGKHRSIKIGVNYSTDIGLGLNTKWEHK